MTLLNYQFTDTSPLQSQLNTQLQLPLLSFNASVMRIYLRASLLCAFMTRVCGCKVGKIKRKRRKTASGWKSREKKSHTKDGSTQTTDTWRSLEHIIWETMQGWEVTITTAGKCWVIIKNRRMSLLRTAAILSSVLSGEND